MKFIVIDCTLIEIGYIILKEIRYTGQTTMNFKIFILTLLISTASMAKNHLTFAYPHFPPVIHFDEKSKSMQGSLAPFLRACFLKLDLPVKSLELPIKRYRSQLRQGSIDFALGNKIEQVLVESSYIGMVEIARSEIIIVSKKPIHSTFQNLNIKNSILALNQTFTFGGIAKRIRFDKFANTVIEVHSDQQAIDLLKRDRVDIILTYQGGLKFPKEFNRKSILSIPTFFAVSKAHPQGKTLLGTLDHAALETLSDLRAQEQTFNIKAP